MAQARQDFDDWAGDEVTCLITTDEDSSSWATVDFALARERSEVALLVLSLGSGIVRTDSTHFLVTLTAVQTLALGAGIFPYDVRWVAGNKVIAWGDIRLLKRIART